MIIAGISAAIGVVGLIVTTSKPILKGAKHSKAFKKVEKAVKEHEENKKADGMVKDIKSDVENIQPVQQVNPQDQQVVYQQPYFTVVNEDIPKGSIPPVFVQPQPNPVFQQQPQPTPVQQVVQPQPAPV